MALRLPPVVVRRVRSEDLPFLVDLHQQHFPEGFFARLGDRFLAEYYASFLTDPASCALIAESAGRRVGYLVGAPLPHRHRQHAVGRHGRRLILLGLAALARHPGLAFAFLRTRSRRYARAFVRYRRRSATGPRPATRSAVLHHLVVLPESQGRGVGSLLIQQFELAARSAGCDRLLLVTRSDGPAPVFYRRTGWTSLREHRTDEGTRLTTFSRTLGGARPTTRETWGDEDN